MILSGLMWPCYLRLYKVSPCGHRSSFVWSYCLLCIFLFQVTVISMQSQNCEVSKLDSKSLNPISKTVTRRSEVSRSNQDTKLSTEMSRTLSRYNMILQWSNFFFIKSLMKVENAIWLLPENSALKIYPFSWFPFSRDGASVKKQAFIQLSNFLFCNERKWRHPRKIWQ